MTALPDLAVPAVERALTVVIDPEIGENVIDLGLIYRIAIDDGAVVVEMTTTTRGCPAAAFLKEAVRSAALTVPGVGAVEVKLTYEPAWTPAMLSEPARRSLGI